MSERKSYGASAALKFIGLSLFGLFMFFVPFDLMIKEIGYFRMVSGAQAPINTIAVDHIVGMIRKIPSFDVVWGTAIVLIGIVYPLATGSWKKDLTSKVFMVFKVLALLPLSMVLFKWQLVPNMPKGADLSFIWLRVVVPVTTLVPVGAVFLAFITTYGLMEFFGVFLRPVMRPIWKTPGKSAVDAVASFVGSYSVGLLITDRMYQTHRYSDKEAAIIATGFSTVSATFMVIVANTTGLGGPKFVAYFWSTLVVTFLVTAITARLFPIARKKDTGFEGKAPETEPKFPASEIPRESWILACEAAERSGNVLKQMAGNIAAGVRLSIAIGPTLLSIGYFGLVLAHFGIFNVIGYIFLPFTWLAGLIFPALGSPMVLAGALASSLAEMFIPVGVIAGGSALVKAVVAIVCVSEIIFFSASIPCILSTKIPLSIGELLVVWFERVVLSLFLALPFALILVGG
ncbi:MAG TPA: YjiH family protein [Spirochaetia bacterium]|nr:YjiH family protein [Spirochaetales bacterium]HRY81197.1 YjiH family protein [Spirochaetia bacterium]HRZ89715.1 YjiH family protein [Spirochaetia bacterium]